MTGVRDPREIASFTDEVDVLVVGLGAAGAAAALEASRAGAETLVLERAGGGGGTSAMSGGVLYLGGGTALQHACGFEDSVQFIFRYWFMFIPSDTFSLQDSILKFHCSPPLSGVLLIISLLPVVTPIVHVD